MKALLITSIFILGSLNAAQASVIAVAGKKKITLDEFNKKYNEAINNPITHVLNPPSKKAFLEDLIRYEIGVQEAQKRQLQKDPRVAERINQNLYTGLLEKELGQASNKLQATEREMKAYYKRNPEIRISYILTELKPGASAKQKRAAKQRAQEIFSEVKKSQRKFPELVKLYTDDIVTKNTGGDLGWRNRLNVFPQIYETAVKMPNGQIRGPIETPIGFWIIKVNGKNSYKNARKNDIRAAVIDLKRRRLYDRFFSKLKKKYPVKINTSLIK